MGKVIKITIFKDLDNVISKRRIDAIWEFIKQRVNEYEDIRNNR